MVHYCKVPNCEQPRRTMRSGHTQEIQRSRYCKEHACHSSNSFLPGFSLCENIAKPNSRFCVYHPKCRAGNCTRPRLFEQDQTGRFFCDQHTCRAPNCTVPASGHDKKCEMHKTCARGGCNRYRIKAPDGRGWLPVCANHVIRHCYVPNCGHEVWHDSVFCQFHKCMMDNCGGSKHGRSNFCVAHTCGIEECDLPINHPLKVETGNRNKPRGCFYCSVHECRSLHCHAQASVTHGHCNAHGCTVPQCTNARSTESHTGDYCMAHYTESVRRSAEQIGREKEHAAFLEQQRKQREEQRERERENRIARQKQEELDHLKAERDSAMEAMETARRYAERLQREEEKRRHIEEQERELREREKERERQRKRRSYETASTIGTASLVDHPLADGYHIPSFNGGPIGGDYHHHGPDIIDHVYDVRSAAEFSSEDSDSEYGGGYMRRGRERRPHSQGFRHVRVNYDSRN